MKKYAYCLLLSALLLKGCNTKQSSDTSFFAEKFIQKHKELSENELNTKLDSVLENNKNLTIVEHAFIFFEKGKIHSKAFNDSKAQENYYKAVQLFQNTNNIEYRIKSLINLSNTNIYLKNYTDANAQAIEALDLAKANDMNKYIASANNILSRIYYINKDYEKSFEYLNNSIALQIKEKDSLNLSLSYNNIAILYKKTNDIEKAIAYNQKSLEINKKIKDSIGIGKSYSNIGRIYELLKKPNQALLYYKKAIKNNDDAHIINSIPYGNVSVIYSYQKKLDSATSYLLKAIEIEKIKKNSNRLLLIYNDLSDIMKEQNRPMRILQYKNKIDSLKSQIAAKESNERIKALNKQQKLFQTEKENAQIKLVNNRNRIIFISVFTILLLLGIILFQKNKTKKLQYNDEKNSLELKVLRSQMNPHFIFNALSAIQNSILDNDQIKSAKYLSRFAKLIRQNFDFINHKTIPLKDELDALKNYLDTQQMRFQNKFEYLITISEEIDVDYIEIPPLLLQPFIENSIEHGFKGKKEKGKIEINITREVNNLYFEIIDNGKGINISAEKTANHSTDIFKKRLKLLGNEDEKSFEVKSSEKGTTIKFSLKE